jgi:hypothetical protein
MPAATGAVVAWSPPKATDACEGSVPVTCQPASDSWFPLGSTTVICEASDLSGNKSSCTFTVTVIEANAPRITQLTPNGSTLDLGFTTSEGVEYAVEAVMDLAVDTWEVVMPGISGNGQTVIVALPMASEDARRFYRVRMTISP